MFDQINGLPVHALVVHAAVIFVPLLALGAIVYALVARWRPRMAWAVVLLAVIAPLCALVSKLSGEQLLNRLTSQGLKGKGLEILNAHMDYGDRTLLFSLLLGLVSLVMVVVTMRRSITLPRAAELALSVITVALAAVSGYYVFRTGDSGATAVWGTY